MMIYDGKRISSTIDKLIDPTTYAPLSDEVVTEYEYDGMGRITAIDNVTYEYDTYGQLVREINLLDKSYIYGYNDNGSIAYVNEYDFIPNNGILPNPTSTKTYTYDSTHPDRLINYNGTAISYNSIGCPTTYKGYTATWTRGKLSKLNKGTIRTGTYAYDYNYNAFGQRTSKSYRHMPASMSGTSAVVRGTLLSYTQSFKYDEAGRLICENKSSTYYQEPGTSEKIVYLYDEASVIGFVYTLDGVSNTYYLQRNLLGDVIAIYDVDGTKVGGYAYDAWGNCTITLNTGGIASVNPIRYRGYYYDADMNLYYLNARYYSPEWRRFISPDNTAYLNSDTANGLDLYCYCNNDPVNYADPSGHFAWLAFAALMLFTPIGGVVTQAVVSTVSYAGMAVASVFDEEVRNDMNAIGWNPFNADESATLNSNKVSFYKGVPVFQVSGTKGSMSLGAIFFDKSQGVETLKHERGHNTQLMSMGLGNYLTQIGIPSIWKNENETPWELSASILGGSTLANGSSYKQKKEAYNYYLRAMIPFANIYNIFQYVFY